MRKFKKKEYFKHWNGKNTLFVIYIGSNDIYVVNQKKNSNKIDYVTNNKSIEENITDIVNIIYEYIEKLYKNGGINFMIMNLPPFHLAPANANNKYQYYSTIIPFF